MTKIHKNYINCDTNNATDMRSDVIDILLQTLKL